jgi:predicted RNA-binding protein with TRAM domain
MAFGERRGGYGGSGGSRGGYGGRGGFGEDRELPKPIKPGDELDVEIDEVGTKGDGIARIKNFVVFVAGAKKGEKLRIRIKDVMARFATAEKVGAAPANAAAAAVAEVEAGAPAAEEQPEEVAEQAEAEEAEVEVEAAETEEAAASDADVA